MRAPMHRVPWMDSNEIFVRFRLFPIIRMDGVCVPWAVWCVLRMENRYFLVWAHNLLGILTRVVFIVKRNATNETVLCCN